MYKRQEQGKDFMTQMEQAKIARDAETVNKTDEAEQGLSLIHI